MYRSRASLKNYAPSKQLSVRHASGGKLGGDKSTTNNPDRFVAPTDKVAAIPKSSSTSSTGPSLGLTIGFMTVIPLAATTIWAKKNPEWNPSGLEGSQIWKQFQQMIGNPDTEKTPLRLKEGKKESIIKSETDALSRRDTKKKSPAQQPKIDGNSTPKVQVQLEKDPTTPAAAAVEKNKIQTERRNTIASSNKPKEKSTVVAKKETAKVEQKKKQEEAIVTPKSIIAPVTVIPAATDAAPVPTKTVVEQTIDQDLDESLKKEQQVIQQITGKLNQIDADTKKHAVQVKKRLSAELKEVYDVLEHDMERTALEGLEKLDENGLRVRVVQLATEMKNRTKWEAFRLYESLKKLETELNETHVENMNHQTELNTELLQRELRMQEEVLMRKYRQDLEKVKRSSSDSEAKKVAKQKKVFQKVFTEKLEQEVAKITQEGTEKLARKTTQIQQQHQMESAKRLQVLNDLRLKVEVLNTILDSTSTYEAFSHQVHKVSTAVMALSYQLDGESIPLFKELESLRVAGRGDDLIEAVLDTLPKSVYNQGTPSLSHLQTRFQQVRQSGREAAMTPPDSGMLGYAMGVVLAAITIKPVGPIAGNDAEAILSRAEFCLEGGNLFSAVQELEQLDGPVAEIASDWIQEAKSRLLMQQAINVVKAHVSILATSCS